MSSTFDETRAPLIHLGVSTADVATEIFVLDESFHEAARGLGRLDVDLPPGIYKIRVRTGGRESERYVTLSPSHAYGGAGPGGKEVSFGPLEFSSPAPLSNTNAPPEHSRDIARASHDVHVKKGSGSAVFVCSRDESKPGSAAPAPRQSPSTGLTLRSAGGELLVDLEQASVARASEGDPWAACNVELDPGLYRLSVETPMGRLNQTVVASPGWQTQIYLLQASYGPDADGRRANLNGAAILLARSGFDPSSSGMRLTELARLGLRDHRAVIRPEDVHSMLGGKVENPMLGLFAAYLLLEKPLADQFLLHDQPPDEQVRKNLSTLRIVLAHLRAQLGGEHPDVEALALRIEGVEGRSPRFTAPPVLTASWESIRAAALKQPEILPADSLLTRVATSFWGPLPLLVWREPDAGDPDGAPFDVRSPAAAPLTADQLIDRIRAAAGRLPEAPADLDDHDLALLRLIAPGFGGEARTGVRAPRAQGSRPRRARRSRGGQAAPAAPAAAHLGRALGLPEPVLHSALESLHRKLTRSG
jgi:hypothetical protein